MYTDKMCELLNRNPESVLTEMSVVSSGKGGLILSLLLQVSVTTT